MKNLVVPGQIDEYLTNQPFDNQLFLYKHHKYPAKILNNLDASNHFYYILDFETGKFPFISQECTILLGYSNQFWDQGIKALWQIVHPNDVFDFCQVLIRWINFLNGFKNEEFLNIYDIRSNTRFIHKNGSTIPVILQNIYTSLDEKGNIIYNLCKVIENTDKETNKETALQIFDQNNVEILRYIPKMELYPANQIPGLFINKVRRCENGFIDQVKKEIIQHIDDEYFGVQALSDAFHMSRAQIYRKILSATSLTPGTLIKMTRINEANKLLKENTLNITEISFKVGFTNPSYFIKTFKEIYGLTPKQYQKKYAIQFKFLI